MTQETEQAIAGIEIDISRLKNRPDISDYFNDIMSLSQSLVDLASSTLEPSNENH